MNHWLEIFSDKNKADGRIVPSKRFDIDAKIVGSAWAGDEKELALKVSIL